MGLQTVWMWLAMRVGRAQSGPGVAASAAGVPLGRGGGGNREMLGLLEIFGVVVEY